MTLAFHTQPVSDSPQMFPREDLLIRVSRGIHHQLNSPATTPCYFFSIFICGWTLEMSCLQLHDSRNQTNSTAQAHKFLNNLLNSNSLKIRADALWNQPNLQNSSQMHTPTRNTLCSDQGINYGLTIFGTHDGFTFLLFGIKIVGVHHV